MEPQGIICRVLPWYPFHGALVVEISGSPSFCVSAANWLASCGSIAGYAATAALARPVNRVHVAVYGTHLGSKAVILWEGPRYPTLAL